MTSNPRRVHPLSPHSNQRSDLAAMSTTREFEYLLNAMELAAQSDEPAKLGYAEKRKAVLAYVAALQARADSVSAHRWVAP